MKRKKERKRTTERKITHKNHHEILLPHRTLQVTLHSALPPPSSLLAILLPPPPPLQTLALRSASGHGTLLSSSYDRGGRHWPHNAAVNTESPTLSLALAESLPPPPPLPSPHLYPSPPLASLLSSSSLSPSHSSPPLHLSSFASSLLSLLSRGRLDLSHFERFISYGYSFVSSLSLFSSYEFLIIKNRLHSPDYS